MRPNLDFSLQWEFLPYIKSTHPLVLFCQKTVTVVFCEELEVSLRGLVTVFSRLLSLFMRLVSSRGWNKRMIKQKNCRSWARDKLLRPGQSGHSGTLLLKRSIQPGALRGRKQLSSNCEFCWVFPIKKKNQLKINSTYICREYLSITMQSSISISSIMIKVNKCEKAIRGYVKPLWTLQGLDKAVKDKKLQFIGGK